MTPSSKFCGASFQLLQIKWSSFILFSVTLPQYNALVVVSICIGYVLECNAWT
jgi:hypothetical protein